MTLLTANLAAIYCISCFLKCYIVSGSCPTAVLEMTFADILLLFFLKQCESDKDLTIIGSIMFLPKTCALILTPEPPNVTLYEVG